MNLDGLDILLDCRWLGFGGAGRVTELLLGEFLAEPPAAGRWLLWGDPERIAPMAFAGSNVVPWSGHPAARLGQADLFRVPSSDIAVYLHQLRPLRPGRSVTFVLDTIPVRFEPRPAVRLAKRMFLMVVCQLSTSILTISEWSRLCISRDLRVSTTRISVVGLSVDAARIGRIRAIRRSQPRSDVVVYVGRFASHKNLRRLCRAFETTDFQAHGGRLILVGGDAMEVEQMTSWVADEALHGIDVRGECSEAELDNILGTSRALVQPSLEEGYGLPVVEAVAVGLPVAASATGYVPELPPDLVTVLDPRAEESIASAIDKAVRQTERPGSFRPRSTLRSGVVGAVLSSAGARSRS